jgi:hypothetical protein
MDYQINNMENRTNLSDQLKTKGFKLVTNNNSSFFGDYQETYDAGPYSIRISKTRSQENIDIRRTLAGEPWFDLSIVRASILNLADLITVVDIELQTDFLLKNLTTISKMFSAIDYPQTKLELIALEAARSKQMFPSQFNS